MICPRCQHTGDPAASAGGVDVCAGCGASCVLDRTISQHRPATAEDTATLNADDLQRLRKARGRTR